MRVLTVLAVFAGVLAAGSAGAQSFQQQLDLNARAAELRAQQNLADQRAVILENRLNNLESQQRTQQAIGDLQAQTQTPQLPPPPPGGPPPQIDTSKMATIPDSTLEQSNARVREAAGNRR
jgi:hypothetical protein